MAQVLGNLVSNALHYTPAGEKEVLASFSRPDVFEFIVEDTGEGIPAEAQTYGFDRFYREDPSRSRKDEESGLGLAIARTIVAAHIAGIEVDSQLGAGN